jgi:hypothetical protein
MFKHNKLLIVLFGVSLISALVSSMITSSHAYAASPPSTKVVRFIPSGIRGTLYAPADCWETSLAAPRANAWRCIVENTIYDPCFNTSTQTDYVICDADPTGDPHGLKVMLAHPLPPSTPSSGIQAWIMRLADYSECSFITGASGIIDGKRINYTCTDGSLIVGSPHIKSVWMVKEQKKGQSQLIMTTVVEVWI